MIVDRNNRNKYSYIYKYKENNCLIERNGSINVLFQALSSIIYKRKEGVVRLLQITYAPPLGCSVWISKAHLSNTSLVATLVITITSCFNSEVISHSAEYNNRKKRRRRTDNGEITVITNYDREG